MSRRRGQYQDSLHDLALKIAAGSPSHDIRDILVGGASRRDSSISRQEHPRSCFANQQKKPIRRAGNGQFWNVNQFTHRDTTIGPEPEVAL